MSSYKTKKNEIFIKFRDKLKENINLLPTKCSTIKK